MMTECADMRTVQISHVTKRAHVPPAEAAGLTKSGRMAAAKATTPMTTAAVATAAVATAAAPASQCLSTAR
jgi:hypothetical protein